MGEQLIAPALAMRRAGLCVLPAIPKEKRPPFRWQAFQAALPSEKQVEEWSRTHDGLCIVCGAVSGHLEMIDFDAESELFPAWHALIAQHKPDLLAALVVERTPSGGRHVVYRCSDAIPGNDKLAQRILRSETPLAINFHGKQITPHAVGSHYEARVTLIETRGEGGLFLCAPTPGYELEIGTLDAVPTVSRDDRDFLISSARSLCELPAEPQAMATAPEAGRPGDEYNADPGSHAEALDALVAAGWTITHRAGQVCYMRRPGKQEGSWSATFGKVAPGVLFVFSSNASPFVAQKAYDPFQIVAILRHSGDFKACATALRDRGYGAGPDLPAVDLSGIVGSSSESGDAPAEDEDDIHSDSRAYLTDVAVEILPYPPPPHDPLIYGVADMGSAIQICGKSKTRKSFASMQLGLCFASGHEFMGYPVRRCTILHVDTELRRDSIDRRLIAMAQAMGIEIKDVAGRLYIVSLRDRMPSNRDVAAAIITENARNVGASVISIDSLYSFGQGKEDGEELHELIMWLRDIRATTGAATISTRHDGKGDHSGKDLVDRGSGHSVFGRDLDAALYIDQADAGESSYVWRWGALRDYAVPDQLSVDFYGGAFHLAGCRHKMLRPGAKKNKTPTEDIENAVLEAMNGKSGRIERGELRDSVAKKLGIDADDVGSVIKSIISSGRLSIKSPKVDNAQIMIDNTQEPSSSGPSSPSGEEGEEGLGRRH